MKKRDNITQLKKMNSNPSDPVDYSACDHNEMVEHNESGYAWRCAKCGYVYGKPNDDSDILCPTCGGVGMLCTEAFIGFRNDLCPRCKGAKYIHRPNKGVDHDE